MNGDIKRATELVQTVENTLGWAPHGVRHRKLVVAEVVGKIAERPGVYTWENLAITVEFLRRKRIQVGSPMYLFRRLEEAVEAAYLPPPVSTLAQLVEAAVLHEQATQREDWQHWVGRLTRATGAGRLVAHDAWVAAGRQW